MVQSLLDCRLLDDDRCECCGVPALVPVALLDYDVRVPEPQDVSRVQRDHSVHGSGDHRLPGSLSGLAEGDFARQPLLLLVFVYIVRQACHQRAELHHQGYHRLHDKLIQRRDPWWW